MVEDNIPDNKTGTRAGKIKSALDSRKSRAGQLFINANSRLIKHEGQSQEDDLRTILNRIRKGFSEDATLQEQDDEQPA